MPLKLFISISSTIMVLRSFRGIVTIEMEDCPRPFFDGIQGSMVNRRRCDVKSL